MIEEIAKVITIENNELAAADSLKNITVQSQVKSSCGQCHQLEHCGSGQVAKALPKRKLTLKLVTKLPVKIGDDVVLGLSEKNMLTVAWQVYLWPILGLIIGAAIGQYLVQQMQLTNELLAIFLGFSGGYTGYRLAKFWQSYNQASLNMMPKVLRIKSSSVIKIAAGH